MIINYWGCKFSDYDEIWDDEDNVSVYRCTHPDGTHICDLDNKFAGDKGNCKLIDKPKHEIEKKVKISCPKCGFAVTVDKDGCYIGCDIIAMGNAADDLAGHYRWGKDKPDNITELKQMVARLTIALKDATNLPMDRIPISTEDLSNE